MIKIGLIGTGFMGSMHASCYEALAGRHDFRVTAVADDDPEKAARIADKFGAVAYGSADELIASGDVNTVDICLPTFLHKDVAVKAMRKGYNVFIEKPVCLNAEQAEELLAVHRETGTHVMVGQCIRFWPEYRELKRLLDEKTYGRLVSGVFTRISPRPTWAWEGWLDDPAKSGSAALDLHIHDVDFVRYLFGSPERIKSETVRQNGSNHHIFSLYKYEDAVVSLEGGWNYPANFPFEMAYRVQFEQATAEFSSRDNPSLKIYRNDGETVVQVLDTGLAAGDGGGNISSLGGYYNELDYFLNGIASGSGIHIASLEDGCDSLKLALNAIAAADRGERNVIS